MRLKMITLNLHCLVEEEIEEKQRIITESILKYDIDIIFLQEVAQTKSKAKLVEDNYGLSLQTLLEAYGQKYNLYFEPIKESFGIYDEGVAIMSKDTLEFCLFEYISKTRDYSNWKSRKILVYQTTSNTKVLLATTHFGWTDEYEIFEEQFDLADHFLKDKKNVVLAGDYNITPESKEYKHILNKGWKDLFDDDKYFDSKSFRGDSSTLNKEVRIDYFMFKGKANGLDRKVLFIDQRVSDHYGLYCEIEIK